MKVLLHLAAASLGLLLMEVSKLLLLAPSVVDVAVLAYYVTVGTAWAGLMVDGSPSSSRLWLL